MGGFLRTQMPFGGPGAAFPGRVPFGLGTGGGWFNAPAFADMAAVADLNLHRYAITTVPLGSIPTATAAELCVKRPATFAEMFAYLCSSSGAARWRVAPSGLLVADSQVDQPRIDWQNGKSQLLNEAATQNLVIQSDDMSLSPWADESTPVTTPNAGVSPTGETNAVSIDDNGTGSVRGRGQSFTIANDSSVYVASCFIKAGTSLVASLRLAFSGGTAFGAEAVINLATGAAQWRSGNAGTAFKVEAFPNGWYRLTVAATNNATGNTGLTLNLRPAFAPSYSTGLDIAATGSALFWGADLKIDASQQPSTHVSTGAASVTRAVESCEFSPALEAVMQRSSFGAIVKGQNIQKGGGRMIGAASTGVIVRAASNRLSIVAGDSAATASATGPDMRLNSWAAAVGYDGAGTSLVRNGVAVTSVATTTSANRSAVFLGRDGGGLASSFGDGWFDFLGVLPARPSDARLAELVA
jgi:hypothetical protein